jgi:FkbM family methyltransferase
LALDNPAALLLNRAMLSYAQNMEDVVLARLFVGQETGFYIDVGGGHAVADNVTFHGYLRGWHGIVVEPQAALCPLYRAVRPRDILVNALCGREDGTLELFEAARFHGLSTASASHADAAEKAGIAGQRVRKTVTTLAALCAAHAPATIDVLKIDVEGHEAEVIAGNDWTRFRPRVVLAEAIEPLSMQDAAHRFEPALLAAGYRFAYFDNLNRWYVALEAADQLLPRFPAVAPAWDSVTHLGEFGPAQDDAAHPDHVLAKQLLASDFPAKHFPAEHFPAEHFPAEHFPAALMARLPFLTADELAARGVAGADPAALARIASLFDGGYVVD